MSTYRLATIVDDYNPVVGDLYMTPAGDLEWFAADDLDAIAQHMRNRYRFFLGEWFLDTRLGFPYLERVLIKGYDARSVESLLRQVALDTPGILRLDEFTFTVDATDRSARVDFVAITEAGTMIRSSEYAPFVVRLE